MISYDSYLRGETKDRTHTARPEGQDGQSSSKIKSEPKTYAEWKAMKAREGKK